jgi:hypothetical protein
MAYPDFYARKQQNLFHSATATAKAYYEDRGLVEVKVGLDRDWRARRAGLRNSYAETPCESRYNTLHVETEMQGRTR